MTIRPSTDQDIPAIVALLKLSLGESLMPKSEAFWRWKHIDNPFGKSPVLVAEENNQLIGVRAFMRWEWRQGNKIYKAVRAVDTATHPEHQGKGIFKKLTLQLVEQCKQECVDFIFNTPNASSKPGYLKMGWQEAGKLKIHLRPVLSLYRKHPNFDAQHALSNILAHDQLINYQFKTKALVTNLSEEFLKWRYQGNPNIQYGTIGDGLGYRVIFRLKKSALGTEFRICEWVVNADVDVTAMRKEVLKAAYQSGAMFLSYAGNKSHLHSIALAIGPMVTTRSLSLHNSLSFDFWKPALGDMEVF